MVRLSYLRDISTGVDRTCRGEQTERVSAASHIRGVRRWAAPQLSCGGRALAGRGGRAHRRRRLGQKARRARCRDSYLQQYRRSLLLYRTAVQGRAGT